VTSDPKDGGPATATAAPSLGGATRTSEPGPGPIAPPSPSQAQAQPIAAPQVRDHQRYDILSEHGRGGLGKVSRAHDRELGRDIAIKELISRDHVAEMRFLREALITARLEHPGIVPVYEAGRWADGTPFYAMKLVAGRPLRALIAARPSVDERLALLPHAIAVADAIAYAHGRSIIHRDLKPSNVIVGDFGETVVIDWGLAKDLGADDDPPAGGSAPGASRDAGLTSAGSVMGTPAYMAPEQRRGEPADRRCDVYAIGAMLWELCSLERLPASDTGARRRALRRAGIDQDLAAIIDKALAPDPARRYPDAAALAADLRAFEAGVRIAARRYSLPALLAHWTRRHRRLAWAGAVLAALAIATAALYVHGVALERDRADVSEADARRARASAEASLDELTLQHAELLLQSDPTAALAQLAGYHGSDAMRHRELVAEARGRGAASRVLHPHSDTIYLLAGQPDGSIVSLGEDHRVRRTRGDTTTTIANDVSYVVHLVYAPARHLLAYATSQHSIAILDLATERERQIDAPEPIALEFSPDGSVLAILDKRGGLTAWDAASLAPRPLYRGSFPRAERIAFLGPARIAVLGRDVQRVDLDGARAAGPAIAASVVDARGGALAVGASDGALWLLSPELAVIGRLTACRERVTAVLFMADPGSNPSDGARIAFGCQEGSVGIARRTDHGLEKLDGFPTSGRVYLLSADERGEHLLAASERDAYLHRLTSGLTMHLQGQAARISAVTAATVDCPHLLTGDVNGTMRIWDIAEPAAHVLAHVRGVTFGARYSPDGRSLAVYGVDPTIRVIRLADGAITELAGHTAAIAGVRYAPDGESLLSFSWDDTARLWQPRDGRQLAQFDGHGALIWSGELIEGGARAVTAGDDGRLFAWRAGASDAVALLERKDPLRGVQVLRGSDDIVVQDSAGALWLVAPGKPARQVRAADDAEVTITRASPDGALVAVGQESGAVTLYRTSDWTTVRRFAVGGTIARIEFDPRGRDLLVYSESGAAHLLALDDRRAAPWTAFPVRAKDVSYAPDGELIAISTMDGGVWFYAMRSAAWLYAHDHHTEVWVGRFSPDGTTFISIDRGGTVVARDVPAMLSQYLGAAPP
jgi:WD40 repeat protein